MYAVIGTETYKRQIVSWGRAAERIPARLALNPFASKPLNVRFLREKRVGEKRLYYLVYEDLKLVLLIAASGKKDQQHSIDYFKEHLSDFREIAKCLVRQER